MCRSPFSIGKGACTGSPEVLPVALETFGEPPRGHLCNPLRKPSGEPVEPLEALGWSVMVMMLVILLQGTGRLLRLLRPKGPYSTGL